MFFQIFLALEVVENHDKKGVLAVCYKLCCIVPVGGACAPRVAAIEAHRQGVLQEVEDHVGTPVEKLKVK